MPDSPFEAERQRAIVDVVGRHLQATPGLRTLAPDDAHYKGTYNGSQEDRDGAYHEGTVWGWLLGPFVKAHLKVHKDPRAAESFLAPVAHYLQAHGLPNRFAASGMHRAGLDGWRHTGGLGKDCDSRVTRGEWRL